MPRIHCPLPLSTGSALSLPAAAARHVQVLRMQPGDDVTLFGGAGGEYTATITHMGRSDVQVRVGEHDTLERELAIAVHIAVVMPANDRMDWLVEKATELGVASIQPLVSERSVLRLAADRATKKQAHWQSVAIAACEQSGRNRVPLVHAVLPLAKWLAQWPQVSASSEASQAAQASHAAQTSPVFQASPLGVRWMLSFGEGSMPLADKLRTLTDPRTAAPHGVTCLSGPEGGHSPSEEALARQHGFDPVNLGPRILRAETAPLAVLSVLAVWPECCPSVGPPWC
jgi:16S rRNA (uracil1498-N3)-methyltransferase